VGCLEGALRIDGSAPTWIVLSFKFMHPVAEKNRRCAAPRYPLWVISRHRRADQECPLYPLKQTSSVRAGAASRAAHSRRSGAPRCNAMVVLERLFAGEFRDLCAKSSVVRYYAMRLSPPVNRWVAGSSPAREPNNSTLRACSLPDRCRCTACVRSGVMVAAAKAIACHVGNGAGSGKRSILQARR
jgi:hypothetical protein